MQTHIKCESNVREQLWSCMNCDYYCCIFFLSTPDHLKAKRCIDTMHSYLVEICNETGLEGLEYCGGPVIDKCFEQQCTWSGILEYCEYPSHSPPCRPQCKKCKLSYNVEKVLKKVCICIKLCTFHKCIHVGCLVKITRVICATDMSMSLSICLALINRKWHPTSLQHLHILT